MAPPKPLEALVSLLIPPACRDEVLGDLYERYTGPSRYILDAAGVVPLVLLSRIRRTVDAEILLMETFALYLSFLAAGRYGTPGLLLAPWGLVRLAIPAAATLLALAIADAYADPAKSSPWQLVRAAAFAVACAFLSQAVLRAGAPEFALPLWVMTFGSAVSMLLLCGLRMLFPPLPLRLIGGNARKSRQDELPAHRGTWKWLALGGAVLILWGSVRHAHLVWPLPVVMTVCLVVFYQRHKRGG